ncbi:hypothetical protein KC360_g92 [Hortaea werneckii]|nr:hypothetical protein KC360_g92 [Hortaea werneckii]
MVLPTSEQGMVSSISPPQGTSEHPSGYVALGRRDDVSNSDGVAKFREEDVKIPPDVSAIRSPPRFCRLMQYHLRHCIEIPASMLGGRLAEQRNIFIPTMAIGVIVDFCPGLRTFRDLAHSIEVVPQTKTLRKGIHDGSSGIGSPSDLVELVSVQRNLSPFWHVNVMREQYSVYDTSFIHWELPAILKVDSKVVPIGGHMSKSRYNTACISPVRGILSLKWLEHVETLVSRVTSDDRGWAIEDNLRHVVAACDMLGARTATWTPLPPVSLIVRKQDFLFLNRADMPYVCILGKTVAELEYTIRIDITWVTAINSFIDGYPLTRRMFSESQHQPRVAPIQLLCEVFDVKFRSSNSWLPHAFGASSLLKNEGDAVSTVVLSIFLLVVGVDFPSNMIRTKNVGACDPTYAIPSPNFDVSLHRPQHFDNTAHKVEAASHQDIGSFVATQLSCLLDGFLNSSKNVDTCFWVNAIVILRQLALYSETVDVVFARVDGHEISFIPSIRQGSDAGAGQELKRRDGGKPAACHVDAFQGVTAVNVPFQVWVLRILAREHFERDIGLGDAVGWNTVLEYTGFMPGDAVNRVTEKCLMVDTKACDTSDRRLGQNISSVVLTANATFNHCGADLCLHVAMQRVGFELIPHFPKTFGKECFRNGLIIDLYPLTHKAKVGRNTEPVSRKQRQK